MNFWTIFTAVLLSGCIQLTPKQESLFYAPGPDQYITAAEIRELLPDFAVVADGDYKLTPRGLMPSAAWCNPYASDIFQPMDWDCRDYAQWADEQLPGYAFGKAWNRDHMVNIFIDESREVVLFDAQNCQFVRQSISEIDI